MSMSSSIHLYIYIQWPERGFFHLQLNPTQGGQPHTYIQLWYVLQHGLDSHSSCSGFNGVNQWQGRRAGDDKTAAHLIITGKYPPKSNRLWLPACSCFHIRHMYAHIYAWRMDNLRESFIFSIITWKTGPCTILAIFIWREKGKKKRKRQREPVGWLQGHQLWRRLAIPVCWMWLRHSCQPPFAILSIQPFVSVIRAATCKIQQTTPAAVAQSLSRLVIRWEGILRHGLRLRALRPADRYRIMTTSTFHCPFRRR